MIQTLAVGPLALSAGVLVALISLWLGWIAGTRAAQRRALRIEPQLYIILGVGLVAARVAFVLQHGADYAAEPLSAFDVRDGGWRPIAGLFASAVAMVILTTSRRELVKPLAAALGTAASVWLVATLVLTALAGSTVRLPSLALPALDGRQVELERFKGKPVVVNLWATWCPPCVREMPVLQEAQQQREDVHFVFINQGERAAEVSSFLARHRLDLSNILLDSFSQAATQFGQRGLPTTLFFDASGRLVDSRVGALSSATLAERLNALAPITDSKK